MNAASIMVTDMMVLVEDTALGDALEALGRGRGPDIPVLDSDGRVRGLLETERVLSGLGSDGDEALGEALSARKERPVSDFASADFVAVGPEAPATSILNLFLDLNRRTRTVMVVDNGERLLGVITPADLMKRLCEYTEKKSGNP